MRGRRVTGSAGWGQIERYLTRDMLMPSFAHAVTAAALRASQILQLRRLVPFDPAIFLRHAKVRDGSPRCCTSTGRASVEE